MDIPSCLLPFLWYGITFSLKDSTLLTRPRNWLVIRSPFMYKMLSCAFCTGFHAGWLAYLLRSHWYWHPTYIRLMVVHAFTSAACCYILDLVTQAIEKYNHVSVSLNSEGGKTEVSYE
jgi:hypothetical protein